MTLPYKRSLAAEHLLEELKNGKLFGHLQCDIEGTEKNKINYAIFPPSFKNNLVSKNDFGKSMKTYVDEEGNKSQPWKMLI